MKRTLIALGLLMAALGAAAQQGDASAPASSTNSRYISDEITLSIRERPSNDASVIGAVRSGARVAVLEHLGNDSFARIRTADGTTGWVTARYLGSQPAARTQLDQLRSDLDEARAERERLETALSEARRQLETLKPSADLAQENEQLQRSLAETRAGVAELQQRQAQEQSSRRMLLVGGGLVLCGMLAGLLLPLLGGRRKRRYSDF